MKNEGQAPTARDATNAPASGCPFFLLPFAFVLPSAYRARYVGKRLKHGSFCDPMVCSVMVREGAAPRQGVPGLCPDPAIDKQKTL